MRYLTKNNYLMFLVSKLIFIITLQRQLWIGNIRFLMWFKIIYQPPGWWTQFIFMPNSNLPAVGNLDPYLLMIQLTNWSLKQPTPSSTAKCFHSTSEPSADMSAQFKSTAREKFKPSATHRSTAVMPLMMLFSLYTRQQGFSELPHTFILQRDTHTQPDKMSTQNITLSAFAHTNM